MALFCQNMLEIVVEIAADDPTFETIAVMFVDHFLDIANALNRLGHAGMWDEHDGFYYDVLRWPDAPCRTSEGAIGRGTAADLRDDGRRAVATGARAATGRALRASGCARTPELSRGIHPTGEGHYGYGGRGIAAVVSCDRLRRVLERMLDEREFLSPFGIRALSRAHGTDPFVVGVHGEEYRVTYQPAESSSALFGGNSNWRGPIWMPVNALLIRALLQFFLYYGDSFRVECPTGSGRTMNLFEVAAEITARLTRLFLRDEHGRRPVHGETATFQDDPHWRDHLLFYEYFNGETGAGLGASHQTGWSGLFSILQQYGTLNSKKLLGGGKTAAFET